MASGAVIALLGLWILLRTISSGSGGNLSDWLLNLGGSSSAAGSSSSSGGALTKAQIAQAQQHPLSKTAPFASLTKAQIAQAQQHPLSKTAPFASPTPGIHVPNTAGGGVASGGFAIPGSTLL